MIDWNKWLRMNEFSCWKWNGKKFLVKKIIKSCNKFFHSTYTFFHNVFHYLLKHVSLFLVPQRNTRSKYNTCEYMWNDYLKLRNKNWSQHHKSLVGITITLSHGKSRDEKGNFQRFIWCAEQERTKPQVRWNKNNEGKNKENWEIGHKTCCCVFPMCLPLNNIIMISWLCARLVKRFSISELFPRLSKCSSHNPIYIHASPLSISHEALWSLIHPLQPPFRHARKSLLTLSSELNHELRWKKRNMELFLKTFSGWGCGCHSVCYFAWAEASNRDVILSRKQSNSFHSLISSFVVFHLRIIA